MTRFRGHRSTAVPVTLALAGAVAFVGLSGAASGKVPARHKAKAGHAGKRGRTRARADRAAGTSTATPIKHVIVIIGENHTFDDVFATYQPPQGQSVQNLLSERIINASGDPGPNVAKATQNTASDTTTYQLSPPRTGA